MRQHSFERHAGGWADIGAAALQLIDAAGVARRIRVRVIVPLLALLFLNSINRVNVTFAAPAMNPDLGLSAQSYGFSVGLVFFGYMLFQLPNAWFLRRVGMRRWLFCASFTWGCAAAASALVHSATGFYACRLVVGIAQGGFAPGLTYCVSRWMPTRYRGAALSGTMLALPVSMIVAGPLSAWLMQSHNPFGMPGWRWMVLFEAAPTVVMALIILRSFPDEPRVAHWLSGAERNWLAEELRESAAIPHNSTLGSALMSARLWGGCLCWFSLMAGTYGITYWLPQIITEAAHGPQQVNAGLLSALPWAALGLGMVLNSWHSDRTQERYLHVAATTAVGGVCLALAGAGHADVMAFGWLVLAAFFMGAAQSTFWTTPSLYLPDSQLMAGLTVISMAGNVAGILGPPAIGALHQVTASFTSPALVLAALLVLGGVVLHATSRWRERGV